MAGQKKGPPSRVTFMKVENNLDEEGQSCSKLRSVGETATASIAWASCSVLMTLLNKNAVSGTNAPYAVVVVQMVFTVLAALVGRNLHFGEGTFVWAASVPLLFVFMMASSMLALQYVTVGTFVVVRNLGPLVTLGVESLLHKPDNLKCDLKTTACLLAIALGVVLYEWNDLSFSSKGLTLLIINLFSACAERMLQRHLLAVRQIDVSKPALMLLNNGIGALIVSIVAFWLSPGDPKRLAKRMHQPMVAFAVGGSCVLGALLSYTGLWLQSLVTATSFMVLGCVTKIVVIACGIAFLGDSGSPLAMLGALISIAGGAFYSRLR